MFAVPPGGRREKETSVVSRASGRPRPTAAISPHTWSGQLHAASGDRARAAVRGPSVPAAGGQGEASEEPRRTEMSPHKRRLTRVRTAGDCGSAPQNRLQGPARDSLHGPSCAYWAKRLNLPGPSPLLGNGAPKRWPRGPWEFRTYAGAAPGEDPGPQNIPGPGAPQHWQTGMGGSGRHRQGLQVQQGGGRRGTRKSASPTAPLRPVWQPAAAPAPVTST